MAIVPSLLGSTLLLTLSVPLAFLALLTTTLAFATLWLRLLVVYADLFLAFLHSFLAAYTPRRPRQFRPSTALPASPSRGLNHHQRARRPTNPSISYPAAATTTSSTTPTPTQSLHLTLPLPTNPTSLYAPSPTLSLRDFEGVGGWLDLDTTTPSAPGDDDALWMGAAARLELPAATAERRRMHRRTLSSQSIRLGVASALATPAYLGGGGGIERFSPLASRRSTPVLRGDGGPGSPEGYFSMRLGGGGEGGSPEEGWGRRKGRGGGFGGGGGSGVSSGKGSQATIVEMDMDERRG